MRTLVRLLATTLLFAACQTPPPPKPAEPVAPPPAPEPAPVVKAEPLTLNAITVENQTLVAAELSVSLTLGPDNTGTEAAWKATFGDTTLGEGTAPLTLDATRSATITLPIEFGRTYEALLPFQTEQVTEIALVVTVGGVTQDRAVRARSPLLPVTKILSVQASREAVDILAVTYLLQVRNPNPFDVRAGALLYKGFIAGKAIADTELPLASKVPASSNMEYEIPAQATPANCGKEFSSIVKQTDPTWAFTGTVSIQGVAIPIDLSGTMKLSQ